ncbi:hypothetical protein [Amycolatopsis thermoflava]|uniref:hypothetical protein n=1 Tax=Amycolatopsis thermoflava TaxID=84480 RepID=UPI003659C671
MSGNVNDDTLAELAPRSPSVRRPSPKAGGDAVLVTRLRSSSADPPQNSLAELPVPS